MHNKVRADVDADRSHYFLVGLTSNDLSGFGLQDGHGVLDSSKNIEDT